MTREKARICLKNLKSDAELYDGKVFKLHLADSEIEALEVAIKLLEQENDVLDEIMTKMTKCKDVLKVPYDDDCYSYLNGVNRCLAIINEYKEEQE